MKVREKITEWQRNILSISEKPLLTSAIVLLFSLVAVLSLSYRYYKYEFHDFWGQVLAEAHGTIFDIAVIGILLVWLNQTGERRMRIRAYKDEIDDFRLWESEEAAFRTAGNIKRLNRHGINDIDLVNCYMGKANLNYVNLEKANLNYANLISSNLMEANLKKSRLNQTRFENCSMNSAVLDESYANGAVFKDCYAIKSSFLSAYLIKADFTNAYLMEASFNGAYLSGADFNNANLYKADFRGAKGLSLEQMSKAKSLYLAEFDDEFKDLLSAEFPELIDQ